jgi:hypothetical protein
VTDDDVTDDRTVEESRLMRRLGDALGPDEPPAGLEERSNALFALADLDRNLAELLAPAEAEAAGVRGTVAAGEPLLFESAGGAVTIEVTLTASGVHGQILGDPIDEVTLERVTGGHTSARVDALGRFSFDDVAPGPVRLRLAGSGTRPVSTDWFLL